MMSDFFRAYDLTFGLLWKKDSTPTVNVAEDDKKFEIEFATPGLKRKISNYC